MISEKLVHDLIAELNQTDETDSLEAKRGSELGKSVLETVCSLSNEPDLGGGTILLGVEKEELTLFPVFSAVGVDNVDKVVADISTQCASVFNVPVRPMLSQEIIDRKCVIRIDVQELAASQKPLYFSSQGLPRGAFRRIGSTDQRCTGEDLQIFYAHRSGMAPDKQIISGSDLNDIDREAVSTYRSARALVNPLAEELNWNDVDLLYGLSCIAKVDGAWKLTRTGLVTFGSVSALRRLDASNRIDYIRINSKDWVQDPDNRFESIEIRGPAMRTIGKAISAILDDIPKSYKFQDGTAQRTDVPLVPERVLREAVVNAVAHRSYRTFSPIQILRYSNRVEIRNPGYSLKSQDRFDEPGSALRNPDIAEILHETRFAETKGSGIRVMRQKMTEVGLSEPTFISSRDDDKFSATFLLHHFLSEADWTWLASFSEFSLNDEQRRALIFVREMGAIDNSTYRHLNKVDTLAASVSLRRLKEAGLVQSRGSGSKTHYVPTAIFLAVGDAAKGHAGIANMHASGASMHVSEKAATLDVLPRALQTRIRNLRKRMDPDDAESIILEICLFKPASAEEIAQFLGRQRHYVANRFLYRMVKQGILEYTIPDMLKHPNQRFKAILWDDD